MFRTRLAFAALAGMLSASIAQATMVVHLPAWIARLTPQDIASRLKTEDDQLSDAVIITSENARNRQMPAKGAQVEDGHLRVEIDRASGAAKFQIRHDLVYFDAQKHFSAASFLVDDEVKTAHPVFQDHWLDGCPATDAPGQCNKVTRIVFEVPESVIRQIASVQGSAGRAWPIRFKDANGSDVTTGLPQVEVAAIVDAYDAWQSKVSLNSKTRAAQARSSDPM